MLTVLIPSQIIASILPIQGFRHITLRKPRVSSNQCRCPRFYKQVRSELFEKFIHRNDEQQTKERGVFPILRITLGSAFFWVITPRVVVIPCRRFGTTYRHSLQGSRNPRRISSAKNYNYTQCNIPEDRRSHLLRCGSLKLRKNNFPCD